MRLCKYLKAVEDDAGKLEDFNDIICDTLETLEVKCPHLYNHMIYRLHCLAYGEKFDEGMANEAVANIGEHWTYKETTTLADNLGIENTYAFYVVMNYLYATFSDTLGSDTNTYAKMARTMLNSEAEILKFYMMN